MCTCLYKTAMVFGTGLLTGAIGAGSGAFASKMLGTKLSVGSIHGLVSGFSFGSIAKFADYVLPNGEEGRCHQISAWCIGFISGNGLGYGALKLFGMGLSTSKFLSVASLTSVVGVAALLGAKVAHHTWKNRECCRNTIRVLLPSPKGPLLADESQ